MWIESKEEKHVKVPETSHRLTKSFRPFSGRSALQPQTESDAYHGQTSSMIV